MDLSKIEYLGLAHVLKRGTGEILEEHPNACLLRDTVSGVSFLACEDVPLGLEILHRNEKEVTVLMVSNPKIGELAVSEGTFEKEMECYQVAYYGAMPTPDERLSFRAATLDDFPLIAAHYHMVDPDELREIVRRGLILLGYFEDEPVGFIGEHLEGSMGLLVVFPQFRRMGFGFALEQAQIARTLKGGSLPFAQIDKNNLPSLRLQEKLGMTRSEHTIMWLWKEKQ